MKKVCVRALENTGEKSPISFLFKYSWQYMLKRQFMLRSNTWLNKISNILSMDKKFINFYLTYLYFCHSSKKNCPNSEKSYCSLNVCEITYLIAFYSKTRTKGKRFFHFNVWERSCTCFGEYWIKKFQLLKWVFTRWVYSYLLNTRLKKILSTRNFI